MRPPPTLSAKLVLTGTALLLLALASIGLTLWVTWNLQGGAAAVNEAGRMRMQTYRMALDIASGAPAPEVATAIRGFDDSLNLLAQGDPSRPLFVPWSAESRERFQDVRQHWQALRERWASPVPPEELRPQADAFVARVDGFVVAIETQIARWTAVLHAFQLVLVGLAIASAVVMFYAGYLFVLNPLARLKRGLAALQAGELGTRIEVGSRDEFGELAAGFNEMAQTLQSLYTGLEEKVRAKTLDLERERQRLADLYQVSAFVAKAPSLEALAQGFVRRVRRIAHADAAAVRWSDEGRQCYLLLAQDRLPEELARSESCVETGSCLCGAAAPDARTRVVPIAVAGSGAPALKCRRAGFATVACVPVRLHGKVLAEVDLFYREPVALGEEERGLLDALASHLAGAMEALRAGAMEREAAVAQERGLLARELHDSIAQSLAFLKIQVQLLRQAAQRRDAQGLERIAAELDAGVRESQADVRELLLHFRTRASEEDIEPALRTTLQKFEHQTGLAAQLRIEGRGLPPLPQDVQVQVLHIVQEALSNVRKHAGARHVELRVSPAPHWRFEIRDDGAGFEPDDPRGQTHVGLDIMRERAERIGARVQVRSAPGEGCTVLLELTTAGPGGAHAEPAEAAA
ncbi:MAG: type IV pili methyl-accepting chemotaxis transducer N-terminal domain-containing protein [Burkholderiales bacterium]|nr:type IV pili methyl-accepting chemotaxis transducer N-terminal domain-containing protein [Burkholderiales bacterium]